MSIFNAFNRSKDFTDIDYKKRNAPTDHQYNYRNYLQRLEKCKTEGDSGQYGELHRLFEAMKTEIIQQAGITSDFSDEEYCNLAAWFAVNSCNNHGLSGYSVGKVFVDIQSVDFLNCLVFSMIFIERRNIYAFLIDMPLVLKLRRQELRKLQENLHSKLYIYIKLNTDFPITEDLLRPGEKNPFSLWNPIDEQFYAVIGLSKVTEEIEDGYPIDVYGYEERFKLLKKTPELIALEKQLIDNLLI